MSTKYFRMLTSLAAILIYWNSLAYDFEVDGIYYTITNENTQEVELATIYGEPDIRSYTGDVVIPEYVEFNSKTYNVSALGERSFWCCWGLTSITIPQSVKSIGNEVFYNCKNLISIEIPISVDTIGDFAFQACSGLESITLVSDETKYNGSIFYGCSKLSKDKVYTTNNIDGVIYNKTKDTLIYQQFFDADPNFTIPNYVTDIGSYAFYLANISNIEIPDNIKYIRTSAFDGCMSLTTVTFSDNVEIIEKMAFADCYKLKSIKLPKNLKKLGYGVFMNCDNLLNVEFGPHLETIEGCCFYDCYSLPFLELPNSLRVIGNNCFEQSGLKTIKIPASVTTIGDKAFTLTSIRNIYYASVNPAEGYSNIFPQSAYSYGTLYVPGEAVEQYKTISPWIYFDNIQPYQFAGIEVNNEDSGSKTIVGLYSLQGLTVDENYKGIVIIKYDNGSEIKRFQ